MAEFKAIKQISEWRGLAGMARLSRLAPTLASLALIALIAWVLADVLWTLTAPPQSPQANQVEDKLPKLDGGASAAARALFGSWDERASKPMDVAVEDTVETSLPLTLVGVFVSDAAGRSGALISSGRSEGVYYSVGDTVPGNAILESVDNSGVMFRRGARIERLSFPQAGSGNILAPGSPAPTSTSPTSTGAANAPSNSSGPLNVSSLGEQIQEYRELADKDPREALSQLGLEQVSSEEVQGYRVGDLPDNQWIRQTGLQDGDILLSVNGHRIGDPDVDRLEIDNFFAEGRVRLEIMRGERRFFVNAKLSP